MTRFQLFLAFLYFFVLLVILPVFCSDKIYSLFYQEDPLKSQEAEAVKREHRRRGVRAYLQETDPHSLSFHRSLLQQPLDNLIVIIAKDPQHEEDKVLSQLVTEVDRNIRQQRLYRNAMLICNASKTSHEELQQLFKLYPMVRTENTTKRKEFNEEEVLRRDFVQCVRQGQRAANFKHLTLIRDVVVPFPGFLETLNQFLHLRITHHTVRGELVERDTPWLFLHLHEPLPFKHYEMNGECLWELVLLAVAGGMLFFWVFRYLEGPTMAVSLRIVYSLYGALYFVTFAVVVGRPYISELRRLAAVFYRVYDPPEAVHFSAATFPSASLQLLMQQLADLRCSLYSPFHKTLDRMVNSLECPGFVASPSFVSYAVRNTPQS